MAKSRIHSFLQTASQLPQSSFPQPIPETSPSATATSVLAPRPQPLRLGTPRGHEAALATSSLSTFPPLCYMCAYTTYLRAMPNHFSCVVTDQGCASGTAGSAEGGAGGWVQGTRQLLGLGGQHGPSKGSTKARTTRGTTRARDGAGGDDWDGKTRRGPCGTLPAGYVAFSSSPNPLPCASLP